MSIEVRPITRDELPAFLQANASSFGWDYADEAIESFGRSMNFERTTSAWDGSQVVGTAGVSSFDDLTVPGATVPTAGVTWVSVRPTHRRQGVLTSMMRQQLDRIHDHGEPLAALWASESPIYSRFGYGCAAEGVEFHIDRTRTRLRHLVAGGGRTKFVTRAEALAAWPAVYDRVRLLQPGWLSRSPSWWEERSLREPEQPAAGWSKRFMVQYEEAGEVRGYVKYCLNRGDAEGSATTQFRVLELVSETPAAYSALWEFVFGVDLVATISGFWRPVEEPLIHMLEDPRRFVRRTQDTLWVRIMDVAGALEGRKYRTDGRVVLELSDPFCPWNAGRYVLEAGPGGATCKRTTAAAEISLSTVELAAAYLGGTGLSLLQRAGRVEGDLEAVRRADALLAWDPAPWCPEVF